MKTNHHSISTSKRPRAARLAACVLWLVALSTAFQLHGQSSNTVVVVPLFDDGSYDGYGESDPRRTSAGAGFGAQSHVRGAFHSYLVFRIPPFAGTVTDATLTGSAYAISPDGSETLQFFSVTSSVAAVRAGGLGHTDIYDDLGSGTLYGSMSFFSGFNYMSAPLNTNAVAAIQAARGGDFIIGGALLNPDSAPIYNEFINFPFQTRDMTLVLGVSGPVAPSIYEQPPARPLHSISNASPYYFNVGAAGVAPLSYTWYVDGVSQGTSPSSQLPSISLFTNPVPVFVVVNNAFGSVTSSVVQAVLPPASFGPNFTNLTLRVGDDLTFAPNVQTFAYPSSWEWRRDGVLFSTDDNFQLYLNDVQLSDSGDYTLTISNSLGQTTSPVMRVQVIETPPIFWQAPYDSAVPLGSLHYFGAVAVAGPPPSYQWYFNGAPVIPGTNDLQSGTSSTLELPIVSLSHTGSYVVVASNIHGRATSQVAHLTAYYDPPVFYAQPNSATVYPGAYVAFSVSVSGQPYPTLQWYHDGVLIPFASSTYFQISGANSNSAGNYFCVASNASGSTTSQTATVTVLYVPPIVQGLPPSLGSGVGATVYFYPYVLNPPAGLQLQFYETNVAATVSYNGGNSYSIALFNVETNQSGPYRIIATNANGASTSSIISLSITTAPPVFTLSPYNQTVREGATVQLLFNAYGAPFPQFSLYHDGVRTGLNNDGLSYTLPYVTLADAGEYYIVASNRVGMATSWVAQVSVQRSGPLDRWTIRNPYPQGKELLAVTFGQGRFVAVGKNGAIINSTDGTNWNLRSLVTTSDLLDVTYGNGRFVVVGENGLVLSSTNGHHWAQQTLPVPWLYGVTYGDGRFVAVGQRTPYTAVPTLWTSTNAVDWMDASDSFPTASFLRGVAYGPPGFVAVDAYQGDYHSADLLNWTSGTTNVYDPESVRFLNGRYVAVGSSGAIAVSLNGVAWTKVTFGTRRLYDVAFGGGQYVVVANKGEIRRSSDALNWSAPVIPTTDRLQGVTYGNGLFVAVGEVGNIFTSADGVAWANQLRGSGEDLDGLEVANGLAVAVGKNDTLLTSTDGTTWTRQHVPSTNTDWYGVTYAAGQWVVVGESTNILVSTNAVDWVSRPVISSSYSYLKGVVYAQGRWVAVGVGGLIMSSTDTVTWSTNYSGVPYDLNDVTYGNGLFVIAGDHGTDPQATLLISTDGITWENRTAFIGKNARGIAFANGTFIVPYNDGGILYGNATNNYWNSAVTGITGEGRNLRGGTWSNGLWVVVGNDGRILTCAETNQPHYWFSRITPTLENLHAVRYINKTFIAVGNQGLILQSDPLEARFSALREGNNLRLIYSSPWEAVLILQHSTNFNWTPFQWFSNAFGIYEQVVPLPPGPALEFFQVVKP